MRREFLICLLLSAITLFTYWQVWNYDFINLDDPLYVTRNPQVQAGLSRESVVWAFTTTHAAFIIPLTWLSFMLDFELYGLNPGGYHLTNLLLHIANALLLFFILKRMTGALWRSGFVAALFAIHPLHVESVAWVTERKDVLSTLFWMLTLWAYIGYVKRPGVKRYLLLFVPFALGLMAKPMLVTLPFVLLLLDYWPLERIQIGQSFFGHTGQSHPSIIAKVVRAQALPLVLEKTPLFVLAAVSSVVTFLVKRSGGALGALGVYPLTVRLANALVSYVSYLGKMIWPHDLAVLYPHPGASLPMWQAGAAGLMLLCVSIAVIRLAKRYPYLTVGWFWYLGTLLPVIGLVQVGAQAMADRFTYVPLIGLFIMISWGFAGLLARWRIVFSLAVAGLLSSLMLASWLQVRYWRNSIVLYEHALAVTENNYLVHNNLGDVLEKKGDLKEASEHYSKAVGIKPDYAVAHNNLGEIKARQGMVKEGMVKEAMSHYYQALQSKPDYAKPYNNLGIELAKQGKLQEAVFHLSRALEIVGAVLARQGKVDEAMAHFLEALRIDPSFARAYNNLGEAFVRRGKLDEAAFHFTRALEIEPSYVDGHCNLGAVLARQGKVDEAMAHFSEALRIKPDSVEALNNMGVILARQGKFQEAIDQFSRALQLEPDSLRTRKNMNRVIEEVARRGVAIE